VAPQLSCIYFGCQDANSIDHTVYLEMLRSRWKMADRKLKASAFLAYGSPLPQPATLVELDALRQEGLDILLLDGVEAKNVMRSWTFPTAWN
jgi:hypothetical protein